MNPSDEARDYVSAALSIISNQVRVERGLTSIRGAGSEGRVMEAVRSLKKAHDLQPTNATIHFAYASSLRLAMKGQDALAEIQRVVEFHPQLALARFTR
jgi:Flp pilus assembly protein TadD